MTKKLTKLTKKQESQLVPHRDKWIARGLRTGVYTPEERASVHAVIAEAYRVIGRSEPVVLIARSPYEAQIMCGYLAMREGSAYVIGGQVRALVSNQVENQVRDHVRNQVENQVESQIDDQVRDQVESQVGAQVSALVRDQVESQIGAQVDQVSAQVRAKVGAQVRALVRAQVDAQVDAQVSALVRDQVESQVGAQVSAQVSNQVRAQVDAQVRAQVRDRSDLFWLYAQRSWVCRHMGNLWPWWTAWFTFFTEHCGIDPLPEKRDLYERLSTIGPRYLQPTFAVVSDYPMHIRRDEQNRLHSERDAAVLYADGFALWVWHGVSVPREWIESPQTMDARAIIATPNMEQRAAGLQIMGWTRVMSDLNARVIDTDPDPAIGELLSCDGVTGTFLRVRCGTGRTMTLRTPPGMRTAMEAQLWVRPPAAKISADMIRNMEART